MTIRFNSKLLIHDLDVVRTRKRLSLCKVATRIKISQSTLSALRSGKVQEITVTTLARIIDFLDNTDIEKYIYDDGE